MKKLIPFIFLSLCAVLHLGAQSIDASRIPESWHINIPQKLKTFDSQLNDVSRSSTQLYVDYGMADMIFKGASQTFGLILPFNSAYNAQDTGLLGVNFAGIRFVELLGYFDPTLPAVETFEGPFPYPSSVTVTIDSVFTTFSHMNTSGDTNKLFLDIRRLSITNRFVLNQAPLYSDSIVVTSGISSTGTWGTGQSLVTWSSAPAFEAPANAKLGISLRYEAPKSDTVGIVGRYVQNPLGGEFPNDVATKTLFPYSSIQVPTVSPNLLNTSELFYTTSPIADTSFFKAQNWSLEALISFVDVTGYKETISYPGDLFQNEPNPFKEETKIRFFLKDNQSVKLLVRDISGKIVSTEELGYREAGSNAIYFSSTQLPSGVYFYQLESEKGQYTPLRKMILAR